MRLQNVEIPMRQLTLWCEAPGPFSLPLGETLGPYYAWRGLIGAAITETSTDLTRSLFKLEPMRDPESASTCEAPTVPWRMRLAHLYAREIPARFALIIDIFGEEPCNRAEEMVEVVRMAGSGASYTDWRTRRQTKWGLNVRDEDGRPVGKVCYEVAGADLGSPRSFNELCGEQQSRWQRERVAVCTFRTLTVMTERPGRAARGVPLAVTGDIDAAGLIGNALRRLIVLDHATRRERSSIVELEAALAEAKTYVTALRAEAPMICSDVVTVPLQRRSPQRPRLSGLIGSARFAGGPLAAWCAGFLACEWLGIGESTAYGAGQVSFLPATWGGSSNQLVAI
jgi:hypothetical protein